MSEQGDALRRVNDALDSPKKPGNGTGAHPAGVQEGWLLKRSKELQRRQGKVLG